MYSKYSSCKFALPISSQRLDKLSEEWKRNGSVKLRKIVCSKWAFTLYLIFDRAIFVEFSFD